jgi:hypothetical protein
VTPVIPFVLATAIYGAHDALRPELELPARTAGRGSMTTRGGFWAPPSDGSC